jgi:hypothetical protein
MTRAASLTHREGGITASLIAHPDAVLCLLVRRGQLVVLRQPAMRVSRALWTS